MSLNPACGSRFSPHIVLGYGVSPLQSSIMPFHDLRYALTGYFLLKVYMCSYARCHIVRFNGKIGISCSPMCTARRNSSREVISIHAHPIIIVGVFLFLSINFSRDSSQSHQVPLLSCTSHADTHTHTHTVSQSLPKPSPFMFGSSSSSFHYSNCCSNFPVFLNTDDLHACPPCHLVRYLWRRGRVRKGEDEMIPCRRENLHDHSHFYKLPRAELCIPTPTLAPFLPYLSCGGHLL